MKGINIFTIDVSKDFSYNYDKIIQVKWKKGNKKILCHTAFWNFRLRFELSSLPPLNTYQVAIWKCHFWLLGTYFKTRLGILMQMHS
jgi:hypothetical protein